MTDLVLDRLRHLAAALADLHGRVRQAVAGEVSRAAAEAVADVLAAALGGQGGAPARYGRDPYGRAADPYARDDWDADPDWDSVPADPGPIGATDPGPAAAALVLGVAAGRWWLGRRSSPWAAAGVGLGAGALALAGGPVTRAAAGVLYAVHRLLAATDALGAGARALGRP